MGMKQRKDQKMTMTMTMMMTTTKATNRQTSQTNHIRRTEGRLRMMTTTMKMKVTDQRMTGSTVVNLGRTKRKGKTWRGSMQRSLATGVDAIKIGFLKRQNVLKS